MRSTRAVQSGEKVEERGAGATRPRRKAAGTKRPHQEAGGASSAISAIGPSRATDTVGAASAAGWSAETAAPGDLLALQRAVGNAAVGRLIDAQRQVSVQREEDPQRFLTKEYWQERAGASGTSDDAVKKHTALRTSSQARAKGWKQGANRKIDDILGATGKGLLEQLETKKGAGKLKLYRAMSEEEAEPLLAYWGADSDRPQRTEEWIRKGGEPGKNFKSAIGGMRIGKHLGDRAQAEKYQKKGKDYAVMVEFTLKPGAHEYLFAPQYAALGPTEKMEHIRASFPPSPSHKNATKNEGTLSGYIGVKAENEEKGDGAFSLSIASERKSKDVSPSQLLFQLFVESVKRV